MYRSITRTCRRCSHGSCRTGRPRPALAERNPHFHRVDEADSSCPYIDQVLLDVVDSR